MHFGTPKFVYIIADGRWAQCSGDTAHKRAIEVLFLYAQTNYITQISTRGDIINFLKRATSHTLHIVYNEASKNIELRGMGTTLTVATIIKSKMYCAHVGDSRIYFLSEKNIKQITTDHSIVRNV
ncbi:hypothetical protein AN396_01375 [Candidatus Epulonipiscium fishelsonii]|uniref:Uncharacterized protein n=1 Tax=Candidatus Epulonipiscium fishelsonii TaxID=77094 RepID=A0ACC8XAC0_9FIRM|nr:hypothetical protein AN396_01375 [Epulopiscium sp. SCG-B11WGA-EpuloA1]